MSFFLISSYFPDRNRHGLRSTRTGSNCRCNNLFNFITKWHDLIRFKCELFIVDSSNTDGKKDGKEELLGQES